MSDELFDTSVAAKDSPRLAWIKRHGVVTYHIHIDPKVWFAGLQYMQPDLVPEGFFFQETAANGNSRIGEGDTEDDAIQDLCQKINLPMWHEGGAP